MIKMMLVLGFVIAHSTFSSQRPLSEIAADVEKLAAELRAWAPGDPVQSVPAGGDLQASLDRGGKIQLAAGATYTGAFVVTVRGTSIVCGAGTKIVGQKSAALVVLASDVTLEACDATAPGYDQAVIRLGANDLSQTKLEQEPAGITLRQVSVPTHRGKRAIEVNARNVTIQDCTVGDLWDPAGRDSQAIAVLNSSGSVRVSGGTFAAGSEIIMVGGDSIKLAGIQTRGIIIEHLTLARPLAWRTDGVNRAVKNILELKAGIDVTIRGVKMSGSWVAAQTGEGLVITPRDRRVVDNVVVEDSEIVDVGSGIQILGRDYTSFTDGALRFVMRRSRIVTNRATYGGQGRVATISGEPASLEFRENVLLADGDSILYVYKGGVMNADGTTRPSNPIGALLFANNRSHMGKYGLFLNGFASGGPKGEGLTAATSLTVTGNTFGYMVSSDTNLNQSPTIMQRNFPTNTYLTRTAFDQQ